MLSTFQVLGVLESYGVDEDSTVARAPRLGRGKALGLDGGFIAIQCGNQPEHFGDQPENLGNQAEDLGTQPENWEINLEIVGINLKIWEINLEILEINLKI